MRRQSAPSLRMTVEHLLRVFVDVSDMLFKTDLTPIHSGKEKKMALAYDLVKAQVRDVTLLRGGLKQQKKNAAPVILKMSCCTLFCF